MSSRERSEFTDERGVDAETVVVFVVFGVVSLGGEGVAEFDAGSEEGAGLADRFVAASQVFGSGAASIAQEPGGDFIAQGAHVWSFGIGGQVGGLIEGFDFAGDGEVFVCDCPVCDLYWRSGILQPSECLSLASPGDPFDRLGGGPLTAAVVGGVPGCLPLPLADQRGIQTLTP